MNANNFATLLMITGKLARYYEGRRVVEEIRADRAWAKLQFFSCNSKNVNFNKRNKHVI